MKKGTNTILVTGAAGFIGASLIKRLLSNGETVIGIDNLNEYYDVSLKINRIKNIEETNSKNPFFWSFHNVDIVNKNELLKICKKFSPNIIVHLAAQAGVRYSIEKPMKYVESNLIGFVNILELCKNIKIDNFLYASSSSVYGANKKIPFKEDDSVDHPISLYAATKKSNEVMAHSYSNLFNIPATGLRFFTVYGPWGRPDMAPMIFAKSILKKSPIKVFNNGKMKRDFTFIDDILQGLLGCCYKPAISDNDFDYLNPKPDVSFCPHRIFNIGNSNPIELEYFISLLEKSFNTKAIKEYCPMQPGDVKDTYADISKLKKWINYQPKISVEEGVKKFANWYLKYYQN